MTPEAITTLKGTSRMVPIRSLRLDPENPRLPEAYRGGGQKDLAVVLEMGFDAYAVAQSIADNGYFLGEPLLTIPSRYEDDAWIVVEGNRRLTALLGLTDPDIRAEFADPDRWDTVASRSDLSLDSLIPIIVHNSREETHAEVARAHVVGKLAWRPYMQARFIAARVAEGKTIAEVAELIGITKSKAADLYRDQAVVQQAQDFGIPSAEIEKAFSLLTVAMSNTKLRSHVGAPLGSQLKPGEAPIPSHKRDELAELVRWVFGDEDHEPLINDSRQMSQLGNVVANDVGLQALRRGFTLEEAKQKIAQAGIAPRDRLLNRLRAGTNALLAASEDLIEFVDDPQVLQAVEDVEAATEGLRSLLEEGERDRGQ